MDAELLERSLALVSDDDLGLTTSFYARLFADHPSVRPLFGDDIRPQAAMLQKAIVAVLDHLDDAEWLRTTLNALGAEHVSFGVTPEMYGWVAGSLIATMADIGGDRWTPQMTEAWEQALGAIAALMLDAYPIDHDIVAAR